MASDRRGACIRSIHALLTVGTVGGLADGQLLERFAARDGEAAELAFAVLVERHGPMVLRVCRGVLRDGHDAEDAFQATFLILARKARSVRVRDSLGPWLHGVAYRVASTARSAVTRRRSHEREAAQRRPQSEDKGAWDDLRAVVHEELSRLPGRYRAAVVLCCLEGLTQQQAAQQLGWPLGTVQSRLARGRDRLRDSLTRRGLAPSTGLLATLSQEAARAAVPATLATSTVRSATRFAAGKLAAGVVSASVAALTEGVLRTMTLTKMMTLGVSGLLLGAVVTGAGLLAQPAGGPPQAPRSTHPPLMKYELRIWKEGKPIGEPIVAEATQGASVRIRTPHGLIEIRPGLEFAKGPGEAVNAPTGDMKKAYHKRATKGGESQLPTSETGPVNEENAPPEAPGIPTTGAMPGMMPGMMGRAGMPDMRGMGGMTAEHEMGMMGRAGMPDMRGMGGMMGMGGGGMPGMMGGRSGGMNGMRGKRLEEKSKSNGDMMGMMRGRGMLDPLEANKSMMGGGSLDERMSVMERKLDQILKTLQGPKAAEDPHP